MMRPHLLLLCAACGAVANPMDGMMGNMDIDAMRKMDGMDPLPPKQKPDRGPDGLADYPPMKKDIPYIKCSVCQKMAAKAYEAIKAVVKKHEEEAAARKARQKPTKKSQFAASPYMGDMQSEIELVLDKLCDVEHDLGKWMAEYDIVKDGPELRLIHYKPGTCRRECRTMQKACEAVAEEIDEEIGEYVLKMVEAGESVGNAIVRVCNKLSKVCKKGATPPYKGRRQNEEFWPFTDEDVKMEMAKRFMAGKMPHLEQVNEPKRKKPKDDIDALHEEL